jgi:hypothetical protein
MLMQKAANVQVSKKPATGKASAKTEGYIKQARQIVWADAEIAVHHV